MSIIASSFNTFWRNIKPLIIGSDTFSVPTSAWTDTIELELEDEEPDEFAYYADFTAAGITANDIVTCLIDAACIEAAESAGLSARPESLTGKIRLRANSVPTQAITGRYWRNRSLS
ncbi:MAG: hypothetical protein IJ520_02325 [Synergistaceae bacterium]|nr:hypothetical protein [Synergistaceae bacterium]